MLSHVISCHVCVQINAPDYEGKLDPMQYYMRKNYFKTASLMANSCLASTLLGGGDVQAQEAAFEYGENDELYEPTVCRLDTH